MIDNMLIYITLHWYGHTDSVIKENLVMTAQYHLNCMHLEVNLTLYYS